MPAGDFCEAQPLAIDFANGKILVEPAEIAERSDGVVVIRRIRSGHRGDLEFEKLEYFLYERAAKEHFGVKAAVEAIHLTDNEAKEVPELSATRTTNSIKKTEALLTGINAGMFDPTPAFFHLRRNAGRQSGLAIRILWVGVSAGRPRGITRSGDGDGNHARHRAL